MIAFSSLKAKLKNVDKVTSINLIIPLIQNYKAIYYDNKYKETL